MVITLAFLCAMLVGTPLGPNETLHDIWAVCLPVIETVPTTGGLPTEGDSR